MLFTLTVDPHTMRQGNRVGNGSVNGVLDRRAFLLCSAGILVSGCTPNPTIVGGPDAPPDVPPLPELPGVTDARALEADCAGLARSLRSRPGAPWVTGDLVRTHEQRLLALRAARPELRPTAEPTPQPGFTPVPVPEEATELPADRPGALRVMSDRLGAAAHQHRELAVAASGPVALLWASCAAGARAGQVALPGGDRPPLQAPQPALLPEATLDAVETALLAQVHAAIYTIQVALGALGGAEARAVEKTLAARRSLQTRLTRGLHARGREAPAAEPAYDVPGVSGDANAARKILADADAALTRFVGPWVALADDRLRPAAVDTLLDTHTAAVRQGAPLVVWPGWPDPLD